MLINYLRRLFGMIHFKSKQEIEQIRQSSLLVSKTLAYLAEFINEGITTLELDKLAEDFIVKNGAKPGFKGLYKYPYTILTSVNEQVIHGMPNDRPLQNGDMVSVDVGVVLNGWCGDHAYSFVIGDIPNETKRLMRVTKESLYKGIEQTKSLNRVGDIGHAIQTHVESHGFSVVTELTGHGIGREMHESPSVPNYGKKRRGDLLKSGIVLAIEPMINMGRSDVVLLDDGWTYITKDGLPSCHYEHNVAIIDGKPNILSDYKIIETVLEQKGDFYIK